eukprot:2268665-Pyramimonas_sp.AAC.1
MAVTPSWQVPDRRMPRVSSYRTAVPMTAFSGSAAFSGKAVVHGRAPPSVGAAVRYIGTAPCDRASFQCAEASSAWGG